MNSEVECLIDEPSWENCALKDLGVRSLQTTLAHFSLENRHFELSILGTNDAQISLLNAAHRGFEKPTNILSWPTIWLDHGPGVMPDVMAKRPMELGDLALSFQTCYKEACTGGLDFQDYVCHLLVHGILHLFSFDHENDADAILMERVECEILTKMGMRNPYEVLRNYN